MDAHVERLLSHVAAEDLGDDLTAGNRERLYHIAAFACSQNVVPTQEEVTTTLLTFGCSLKKATTLSQQFNDFCGIIQSGDQQRGVKDS